jgi:hypothetical protein
MMYVHSHLLLLLFSTAIPLIYSLDICSTKFTIYATLNRRVKDHESVLDDREKVLEEVQMKDGAVLI